MFAEVIVNQRSYAVDKPFDYIIPENLEVNVKPGSRVIVPFSKGNTEKEGFVLKVKNSTDAEVELKQLIDMAGEEPAFNEDMVPLIEYLHERCLCTYLDIIHTIIPTGTAVKTVEWLSLTNNNSGCKLSETDRRIIQLLNENGGGMDIISLMSYFDISMKSRITLLIKKGILERDYIHSQEIRKKTVRGIRLRCSEDEAREFIKNNPRSKAQIRMMNILMNTEYISTADLVRFSIGSYTSLNALIKHGLAEYFDIPVERSVYAEKHYLSHEPELTAEQRAAVSAVTSEMDKQSSRTILLHGVTGSGKTEVFMRAIKHAVESGRTAMLLVPEISLTPQMVSRFVERFGKGIAIIHSGLSLGERYDQWCRIINGEANIVIGARSAVFAPLENIGIIILDEEHSETYKSEMTPRYHARETAQFRAAQNGAVTLLASATPSIESYHKALSGEYMLVEMKKRYNENKMPSIDIVDMRSELEKGNKSMFSSVLYNAVRENIDNGRQTILFMNRRGFSTFVSCRKCGYVPTCPNCNISLTYHRYDNSLKCHYCGYKHENYQVCPSCSSKYIRYFGGGTQKVEDEVKRLFPDASTIRLDADVTTRKNAHKQILDKFSREKIDILIGTQMVAKGLDFPNVTLVGVVSADTMLHINDFRSGERTFDLLEQVSGRAGRGSVTGRAVIQTYAPDNFAVSLVKLHDYTSFYRKTDDERKLMWYPPYSEMICILITDTDKNNASKAAHFYRTAFGDINTIDQKIAILGPIPSGISKIKNKYRWQILIKCEDADRLNKRLTDAQKSVRAQKCFEKVTIVIDKNPVTIY